MIRIKVGKALVFIAFLLVLLSTSYLAADAIAGEKDLAEHVFGGLKMSLTLSSFIWLSGFACWLAGKKGLNKLETASVITISISIAFLLSYSFITVAQLREGNFIYAYVAVPSRDVQIVDLPENELEKYPDIKEAIETGYGSLRYPSSYLLLDKYVKIGGQIYYIGLGFYDYLERERIPGLFYASLSFCALSILTVSLARIGYQKRGEAFESGAGQINSF